MSQDEDVLDTWYADVDNDGYGDPDSALDSCDPPSGYVSNDGDCEDSTEAAYPGATEICDEIDNDCDDLIDDDVMLLDTFYNVFVWVGSQSNDTEKRGILRLSDAAKY